MARGQSFDAFDVDEKIQRVRIDLQSKHPFFGHLLLHLNPIKMDTEEKQQLVPTMAIDRYGNLRYNPEFVDGLSYKTLAAVIVHEILHPAFDHFDRCSSRMNSLWNCAMDAVINYQLLLDDFAIGEVSDGIILPDKDGTLRLDAINHTVKNVDEKSMEEIYDELVEAVDEERQRRQQSGDMEQDGDQRQQRREVVEELGDQFDQHDYTTEDEAKGGEGEEGNDEGLGGNSDKRFEDVDWEKELKQAADKARNSSRGTMPAGMERRLEEVARPKMNWKNLLHQYVSNQMPYDYTYQNGPNPKYRAHGITLPQTKRENLNVHVALDTSGSIGQGDLETFLGEVTGMLRGYDNITITVIQCDSAVHDVTTLKKERDLVDIEVKGGGGTAHEPVFKHIKEEEDDAQILVCFTDGWTSVPDRDEVPNRLDTIWVLDNHRVEEERFPFGVVTREIAEERNA